MKTIDLPKLQNLIETFVQERDWDQFHTVKNLAMALSVESSELLEIFQWLSEEQSLVAHHDPKMKERIEDEVSDVFFYLLRIVSKNEIDLEAAFLRKLQKSADKYPAHLVKGSAKKYTEY